MKKIVLSVLFFSFFSISYCQTSKEVQIRKLLELSGSGKIGMQVGQSMIANFKKNHDNFSEEFWNEMVKEFNSDAFIEMIVPIYDKHYSESEINELIAFYDSPIGKKMIANMPSVVQESMQVGQDWGKKISSKVIQQMKEKQHTKQE